MSEKGGIEPPELIASYLKGELDARTCDWLLGEIDKLNTGDEAERKLHTNILNVYISSLKETVLMEVDFLADGNGAFTLPLSEFVILLQKYKREADSIL